MKKREQIDKLFFLMENILFDDLNVHSGIITDLLNKSKNTKYSHRLSQQIFVCLWKLDYK